MGILVSVISFAALSKFAGKAATAPARPAAAPGPESRPALPSFSALLDLPPEKTASFDTAALNLLCGSGLPGNEKTDPARCLDRLERIVAAVRSETRRNLHRFLENPAEYRNSEAFYRMGMLVTVIREDFHTRYNPALVADPATPPRPEDDRFFADASNVFLQGLLSDKRLGTCSSMPVLYTAAARRLGYPVFLVAAKNHLFCRWDDGTERMNFEGTGEGVTCNPDSYYRKWPRPISEAELASGAYLRNLTRRQELAVFLTARAQCLAAAGRKTDALLSAAAALRQAQSPADRAEIHRFIAAARLVPNGVLALLAPPRPPFHPAIPNLPNLPPDPELELYRRSGIPPPR